MKESQFWSKADWITGAIAAAGSFALYACTTAPNVTLLDSGEFLVAAQHFGVPHPTGYPLWTLLMWLFHLLPLGNAAWQINLGSGLCAALAVGLCATLLANSQTWCLGMVLTGRRRLIPHMVALAFAALLACSQSMWSQAVITEVYALHALLTAVFLLFCYAWVRRPSNDRWLLAAFFALAFAFSNHQLILAFAPLPYLLVILLRRRRFFDWLFAGLLPLMLGYLGFAVLSRQPLVLQTAVRFSYCVALAFGVFLYFRRFRVRWKLMIWLPCALAAGLLPYFYSPLASSTNPPMNWGYTREAQGFFFSFNRSQYNGPLAELTVGSLGRLMGVSLPAPPPDNAGQPEVYFGRQRAWRWIGFFLTKLLQAFTPVGFVGYVASAALVHRQPPAKRAWVYFLHAAFVLAALWQPLTSHATIDVDGWWLQMPYHTYTNLIFALLCGVGVGGGILTLSRERAILFWLAPALFILPVFTFRGSAPSSSQRGRWFGWMFGHDMLQDLPAGSIVIGGTDPGRFVPTYMIFGESPQAAKFKRDPAFDRRDLYVMTQNALGEPTYMKYLRDQYTSSRPAPDTAFERFLGRGATYPREFLTLPDQAQTEEAVKAAVKERNGIVPKTEQAPLAAGAILQWIWDKNHGKHAFFVEESFPISWTYDYALPHGLVYQINDTKVDVLTKGVVDADFAFWHGYKERLLKDPAYQSDLDAQHSFSKLRLTMGNIYRHRKMDAEAERAYRECLELWPNNLEAMLALTAYDWERNDFEEPIRLYYHALANDPENSDCRRLLAFAQRRKEIRHEIDERNQQLATDPKSRENLRELIELHVSVGDTNKAQPLVQRAMQDFTDDTDMLRYVVLFYARNNQLSEVLPPARRLTELEPLNADNYLLLARAYFLLAKKPEFYENARKGIALGGNPMREELQSDPTFVEVKNDPEFTKLVQRTQLPIK